MLFFLLDGGTGPSASIPVWAYVLGALGIGGFVTGFLTYLGIKRTSSGKIETSDASDLWAESTALRQDMRSEIVSLRLRLAELEVNLAECNVKAAELRTEVLELRQLCGITHEGVSLIRQEIAAVRSDTPQGKKRREEAE